MNRVSFTYEPTKEQKEKKRQLIASLAKDSYVKKWLKMQGVDQAFLDQHSGTIADWSVRIHKCEHCQGLPFCRQPQRGYLLDIYMDGFLKNRLTPCSYQRQQLEAFHHQSMYRRADFPQEMLPVDISALDITKENRDYKAVVAKIIQQLMDETSNKGVYLWGKPGVGKTYLAAGITNYFAKKKIPCAFVNVPKLLSELKLMFQDNNAMEKTLQTLRKTAVLVLDDIGGESVTSWSRDDILLPLLEMRMQNHQKTYFTSNYSFQDLKERLRVTSNKASEPIAAERVMERIQALAIEIFVKGESRRL